MTHDCADFLRTEASDLGADVRVTTFAPAYDVYAPAAFLCPHGVVYWIAPTAAQIARWEEDGTP